MLTAAIGGALIGIGTKMLFDKATLALAKVILKNKQSKDTEVVAEPATQECEAVEEAISEDEVE